MLNTIDNILNRFTMYRVVLYSLIALLLIGFIFALTGQLSISAGGLVINLVLLSVFGYGANVSFSKLKKVDTNFESGLITTLILACILPTTDSVSRGLAVCLTVVLAMATKFLLTYKTNTIFNPAAAAATIVSIAALLPAIWWIGSPPMAAFTAIFGCLILRKQRKFSLFFAFTAASLLILLLVNHISGDQSAAATIKTLFLSYPLIFMGSVMLTEPSTLPTGRYYQVLYGLIVGCVFTSQLNVGRVTSTPQVALIIGNIFALIITPRLSAIIALSHRNRLAEGIYDFSFNTNGQVANFLPGQYLEWTLAFKKFDSRGNRRSFTIASSPTEPELLLATRIGLTPSQFKTDLLALPTSTKIRVSHLGGEFTLPSDRSKPLIFIAGGIGITPFRSMAKYLIDSKQRRQIKLYYQASSNNEFIYQDIFSQAEAVGMQTEYVTGRIKPEALVSSIKVAVTPLVYISGPKAMVDGYKRTLKGLGLPNRQIKTDYFSGY